MPENLELRPMTDTDVNSALDIVRLYDEETYRDLKKTYKQHGLDGQFVLTDGQTILGVTGACAIDGTDRAYWLSDTYLNSTGNDCRISGTELLRMMILELQQMEARILFVELGDLDNGPEPQQRHGEGLRAYEKAGFKTELEQKDYYDRGESLRILSIRLEDFQPEPIEPDTRVPLIVDADELPETEDGCYIDWRFDDNGISGPADLQKTIEDIRKWRGRFALVGVPSDAPRAIEFFQSGGFLEVGRMTDFYEDGVDEVRLRLDLL